MTVQTNTTDTRAKKGFAAVLVGLLANILLAAIKTSVGVLGHSPALLADGINSTSDVAYYVVVSIFVKMANKPADDEHPYGHSQFESIGALLVGSFVITTAVAIFWNSVDTIYDLFSGVGSFSGGTETALFVALGTVVLKIALTLYTQSAGKETNNPSITALAYDHRNDIFSALAAVIGIFLGRLGLYWVDPLAGALVAIVILRTGIVILRESTSDLMDTVPGKVLSEQIMSLLTPLSEIQHIEEIHAHRFGPYLMINITICIDGNLSVFEGDKISTKVEETIKANISFVRTVHVHYHPEG
ncbi:MAG: cation transporter [Chloroflexi bacterium]|mgnify:CR=1 FL=1|jgi:cation diffusion facilitator family transporter|nr:cation transporter [Chloroflexota bacterium]MBT4306646.1 cation transporter [Chloroflexota bacterium]MBT5335921.1 cation transporter [Chloroflexota bacterium]MBT6151547.1 cation transporter [Chloroflexota bacterium]MBT6988563.1 cation transporter [Chloroflexota bacterium]